MSLFFTSDQHYDHKNILKFTNRPFDCIEEMNEHLIKAHNEVIKDKDEVWMLGDFCFGNTKRIKELLRRLNGRKNYILGNHDKPMLKSRSTFLDVLYSIQEYKRLDIEKQTTILFHYGMRTWDKSFHGSWHLYGHSHGTLPPYGLSLDVGVDSREITDEFRPIVYEEIKTFMNKREIAA